jgi:hypothetical protein
LTDDQQRKTEGIGKKVDLIIVIDPQKPDVKK